MMANPNLHAPPQASGPPSGPKTIVSGMPAFTEPPKSAPPVGGPVEMKTMMADAALHPAPAATPTPAPAPVKSSSAPVEMKTMMANASMQPPPTAAASSPAGEAQKTMMAMAGPPPTAPLAPVGATPSKVARPEQRTMDMQAAPDGTLLLPDSEGVVAYARDQAAEARATISTVEAGPAGAAFWLGWTLLGASFGCGYHLLALLQAVR